MKRKAIILLTVVGLTLGVVLNPVSHAWAASEAATLKSVTLSTSPTGTELVLRLDGVYAYKTVQASPDTFFIDFVGAKVGGVPPNRQWVNPVFSGYKLLSYQDATGQPVVRVQVGTTPAQPFVVQKDGSMLRLVSGKSQFVGSAAAPTSVDAPKPAASRLVPPSVLSSGPLRVSKVTFDKHEPDRTLVNVATSRSATYRLMTLANPARLVIDIDGAQNTSSQNSYAADTAVLKGVRIGQFRAKDPSVVRVVADLKGNPAFDVHATPEGLCIELRQRGAMKSTPLDTNVSAPQVRPEESRPLKIAAVTTAPVPVSKVVAPAPTTEVIERRLTVAAPLQVENREAVKADVQSTLPPVASSQQAMAAPLPPPVKSTPEALRAEHAAQTLTPGRDDSPMAAQGSPPAITPGSPEEVRLTYTGEPISLNLKDVDLKDFFRLIHEISGLNIILDPNVSGSVTLVLDSVPWDQALDIVLKNNHLGKVLDGNVLRIARLETLTAEQESQTKLAAARLDASPLVTLFRPINYAKATELATLLKTWAGGGALSRRGTVLVDARANTLIISDVQSQMPIIENVLTKLDKKAKQVSIEARVVLATADFTRTLASSLLGGYTNHSTATTAGTGSGSNNTISIPAPTAAQPFPITTTTPAAASGFGLAAVTNVGAHYFINAAISAAEERDQAKTISRPSIVTQNNVQGMVQQGVEVPIQTSINNTISVQYENATLQMQVTPQVTDDGNIFLIIHVNNASVGAAITQAGPSINTQEATTSVLVPDGGTVVFGGITVTSRSKSATYVPLLGNIPVLGHLFKTNNTSDQDQELLFFVSPKILPG